jgi:nicotinamidase-related amidase
MLLTPERSILVVVHLQARLVPAVVESAAVVKRCVTLIKAAQRLDVPIVAVELNRQGLGPSVAEIAALIPPDDMIEGQNFSLTEEAAVLSRLEEIERNQVVICGLEAHVCVLQTALGLAAKGYHVAVVADATSSRRREDHQATITRLVQAGVTIATTEMVVFEWLQHAGAPAFMELLALIK